MHKLQTSRSCPGKIRPEELIRNSFFKESVIFDENVIGRFTKKLLLHNTIFIETSVLYLSKLHMFSFYYKNLKESEM